MIILILKSQLLSSHTYNRYNGDITVVYDRDNNTFNFERTYVNDSIFVNLDDIIDYIRICDELTNESEDFTDDFKTTANEVFYTLIEKLTDLYNEPVE